MDNNTFFKSFLFFDYHFTHYRYTDMSQGSTSHYIAKMKKGTAKLISGEETYLFSEGDVFYLPPCRYRSYWYGDEAIEFDSYAFSYLPVEEDRHYKIQKLHLSDRAAGLLAALEADRRVTPASVGILYSLLDEVFKTMEPVYVHPKSAMVTKARAYIREHADFTVPELAKYCGISESGLYTAFKAVTGHTPVQEKHHVRMEKAVMLLTTTDLSIEEISSTLGYNSAIYFREVFHAMYGMVPSKLRKLQRSKTL